MGSPNTTRDAKRQALESARTRLSAGELELIAIRERRASQAALKAVRHG